MFKASLVHSLKLGNFMFSSFDWAVSNQGGENSLQMMFYSFAAPDRGKSK